MKRQGGGTFLGLVLGMVLGLGVALAVAVYVTKVPVPFLNKGQTRSADQDAAEARKNKDWDPNSPLYGKNPARQSSGGAVGADASSDAAKADDKPAKSDSRADAKPDSKADAKADTKSDKSDKPDARADKADRPDVKPVTKGSDTKAATSSDPLGDLAKAKAAASSSGVDPFDYYVQAGAYRTNEDAETQKAKLAMMGWEARVTEREQAGRTVFRVRVGPFSKRDDAERIKDKLDNAGLDTTMVRVQR